MYSYLLYVYNYVAMLLMKNFKELAKFLRF